MNAANTSFMLVAAALVMMMTPGLAFFYGRVGRANALTIMIQSVASLELGETAYTLDAQPQRAAPVATG